MKCYSLMNADECVALPSVVQHLRRARVKIFQRLRRYSTACTDNLTNSSLFAPMLLLTTERMLHETNNAIYELLVVPLSTICQPSANRCACDHFFVFVFYQFVLSPVEWKRNMKEEKKYVEQIYTCTFWEASFHTSIVWLH